MEPLFIVSIFVMIFALTVEDKDKLKARHTADEYVKSLLVHNIDNSTSRLMNLRNRVVPNIMPRCYESTLPSQMNSSALCNTKSQGLQNLQAEKL